MQLVNEWCIKMQSIFDVWSESDHGKCWGRAMDGYGESPEIAPIYDSTSQQIKSRIEHLRGSVSRHVAVDA